MGTEVRNVKKLEERLAANPDSLVFSRLADAYRKEGEIQKAVDLCVDSLNRHPDYVTGRIILGRCYLEKENLPQSIEEFKNVCSLDRHNHVAIKMLADIFSKQGMEEKAGDLYSILKKKDPENPSIRHLSSLFKGSGSGDLFEIIGVQKPAVKEESQSAPDQGAEEGTSSGETGPSAQEGRQQEASVEEPENKETIIEEKPEQESGSGETLNSSREGAVKSEDALPGTEESEPEDKQSEVSEEKTEISGSDISNRMDELFGEEKSEDSDEKVKEKVDSRDSEEGVLDIIDHAEEGADDKERPDGSDISNRLDDLFGEEAKDDSLKGKAAKEEKDESVREDAKERFDKEQMLDPGSPEAPTQVYETKDLPFQDSGIFEAPAASGEKSSDADPLLSEQEKSQQESKDEEAKEGQPVSAEESVTNHAEEGASETPTDSSPGSAVTGEDIESRLGDMFDGPDSAASEPTEEQSKVSADEPSPDGGLDVSAEEGASETPPDSSPGSAVTGEDIESRLGDMFDGPDSASSEPTEEQSKVSADEPSPDGGLDVSAEEGASETPTDSSPGSAVTGEDIESRLGDMFDGPDSASSEPTEEQSKVSADEPSPDVGLDVSAEESASETPPDSSPGSAVTGEDIEPRLGDMFDGESETGEKSEEKVHREDEKKAALEETETGTKKESEEGLLDNVTDVSENQQETDEFGITSLPGAPNQILDTKEMIGLSQDTDENDMFFDQEYGVEKEEENGEPVQPETDESKSSGDAVLDRVEDGDVIETPGEKDIVTGTDVEARLKDMFEEENTELSVLPEEDEKEEEVSSAGDFYNISGEGASETADEDVLERLEDETADFQTVSETEDIRMSEEQETASEDSVLTDKPDLLTSEGKTEKEEITGTDVEARLRDMFEKEDTELSVLPEEDEKEENAPPAGEFYDIAGETVAEKAADEQQEDESVVETEPEHGGSVKENDLFVETNEDTAEIEAEEQSEKFSESPFESDSEEDVAEKGEVIPDHVITPTLADLYYQQGKPGLAIKMYQRILKRDPENLKIKERIEEIKSAAESDNSEQDKAEVINKPVVSEKAVKKEKNTESEAVTETSGKKKKSKRTRVKHARKDERPLKGKKIKKKVREKIIKKKRK